MRECLRIALCLLALLWAPAAAQALELEIPVNCTVGTECFIQNYADRDPTDDYADYACGRLSYNGHKGTDFRLRNLAQMRAGVMVRAAAAGIVKGVRDGVADRMMTQKDDPSIKDRECGNGVLVAHADRYETQYCHMMKGSILVKPGQEVAVGQSLGKIGLSGMTEFPHLHFELRRGASVIDPFTGETSATGCKVPQTPLWSATATEALRYIPTGVLNLGFANAVPQQEEVRDGRWSATAFPATATALLFWVDLFGLLPGDTLEMTLTSPKGEVMARHEARQERSRAQLFQYIGKKRTVTLWEKGEYTGEVRILRDSVNGGRTVAASGKSSFKIE